MAYRLIALDLDGTAIDGSGRIRPHTCAAVAHARAKGVEVVAVTGRHHSVTRPYHEALGLTSPAICCNGTYVYDFAANHTECGDPMPREAARAVLAACRRHGVAMLLYTDEIMYFDTPSPHIAKLSAWISSLSTVPAPRLDHAADLSPIVETADTLLKFVVTHSDAVRLRASADELEALGLFGVEYSWHDRVDVMRRGNSKASRLIAWAASQGIEPTDIVAFGDNFNDMEMLLQVGHGVAMGNAPDAVKAAAAETVGSNDTDAIGEAIFRLV